MMSGKSVLILILAGFWLIAAVGGCGDFFEKNTTELESKAVTQEISRVKENPNIGNLVPPMYQNGPQRLQVEDGIKLFYFTKFLPAEGLAATIQQLGFKINTNPSTNQLIIHCANEAEFNQVTAYLEKTDVPPIQVYIDCLVLERFGDVTKDWETTLWIENLFGEGITVGEGKFPNPVFPGAALRESKRGDFGLDFGYWLNKGELGHQVRLVVDVLESRGYLKVLMNPTLEIVNGKAAQVQIRDNAPIEKTVTEAGRAPYTVTEYQWVPNTLTVTPYVYSDGTIGLKTNIVMGSKSKPEGVAQTSIITERSIDIAENRIEPGKSLVIGGMRRSENRSVIRGVPFLKDLPIVGILFSSKDYEENAMEIIFVLTPSISTSGVPYQLMADMVRKKVQTPEYESDLDELLTDPFGTKAYSEVISQQTELSEAEKTRLQLQAAEADRQAQTEQLREQRAIADTKALQAQAQQAQALIEQSQAQKTASEAQAQAAAKEAEAERAKISQTREEIDKAAKEAQEAKLQAQQAQEELQKAQLRVNSLTEEVQKARLQAESIQKQIQELESQAAGADSQEVPAPPTENKPSSSAE